jgi:cyclic pyranopterin monophosphate synthase
MTRTNKRLSHVDPQSGEARMVDVGAKAQTTREAVAQGRILISPEAMRLLRAGALKKGDPLQVARLAGIMAAKQTPSLIPLCHPLPLSSIDVQLRRRRDGFEIRARVRTTAQTGVEMEALTAVSVAALTIYDMVKAADKAMTVTDIQLLSKRGGTSGDYARARAGGRSPSIRGGSSRGGSRGQRRASTR